MLTVNSISIQYEQKKVINDFSFNVDEGEVVSIIGPNGSGKSTLLKSISRQLPYESGSVELDGMNIKAMNPKQIARKLCMLSQKNQAPSDMTVYDLVSYGRYPHKRWFEKLTNDDRDIIEWAIKKTHLTDYLERTVVSLSGGESQRAWIAMALAQRPQILLLDEPTTYLDISHQHEVLELVRELNEEMGMTVVMVLHDLNQASHYSDRVIVVHSGKKAMCGTPDEVMTTEMIREVYRMDSEVIYSHAERKPRIHLLRTAR
ncbi:ABC transporter ATP-binding protein [Sporosarcina gallistercoris]|uniref:ABC transporter ATP-binding protein n=1 Tax=Sporosarcina gallistercoris TaxID=2762245 RepID=A0ABR8PKA6_9BACL|nr:ABC transporter ATP-binding protein [Sporosarcina gallistercoris]MBD7908596.1 ABC transporter ATP-binding protein [Sporosarcina gallistercoris]